MKYRISAIGWYNFEFMVQTILKAVIGPGVTSFGGTKDGGRDATYDGVANFPSKDSKWKGRWIFQVKYVDVETQGVTASRRQVTSQLRKEFLDIIKRRRRYVIAPRKSKKHKGPIYETVNDFDNYILITDVPLTKRNREDMDTIARKIGFKGNFAAIDGREICQFLDLYPDVRRTYPQLLGLADIDHILNKSLYERSKAYVQKWQPRLETFVRTKTYDKAVSTLRREHFIVLDGPPESGKSTIAASISLIFAADGYEIIDLRGPDDVFKLYEPKKLQVFIADDAVGSIKFDPSLTDNWSRDLPGVLGKLDQKHLLLWTTRKYVLEEALSESNIGEAVSNFPGIHEVLVEVGHLEFFERAEILYNHAKARNFSMKVRTLIRINANRICRHKNFTPERIRQLCENVLPPKGRRADSRNPITYETIDEFLRSPGDRWILAYRKISESEKTLLIAVLDFDRGAEIEMLEQEYNRRVTRVGSSALGYKMCLQRLDHSFLTITDSFYGTRNVDFQHPSLRDIIVTELRENSVSRKKYLEIANAKGVANTVLGLATHEAGGSPEHVFWPENEQEFDILTDRLRSVTLGPVLVEDWLSILSALERLIPKDKQQLRLRLIGKKLTDFGRTIRGRALMIGVECFARSETFVNNARYSLTQWIKLIEQYYVLSSYVVPPPRLCYIVDIVTKAVKQGNDEATKIISLINMFDPAVVSQFVARETIAEWGSDLNRQIEELCQEGEDLPDYDEVFSEDEYDEARDEYENWRGEADRVIDTSDYYFRSFGGTVSTDLERLEELVDIVVPPSEPEYDHGDWGHRDQTEYWSIDRLFEDL